MGADMCIAALKYPCGKRDFDFEAGHRMIDVLAEQVTFNKSLFHDQRPCNAWELNLEALIDEHLPAGDVESFTEDPCGYLTADMQQQIAHSLLNKLQDACESRQVCTLPTPNYDLLISGGLSWGDPPNDATEAIWQAQILHDAVLSAIGFLPNNYLSPNNYPKGDPFVVVSGGVVINNPITPVIDLDIVQEHNPRDPAVLAEIIELHIRMCSFTGFTTKFFDTFMYVTDQIRKYGSKEDVADLELRLANTGE